MSVFRIEAKHFGSLKARVLPKDYASQAEADGVAGMLTDFYESTIHFVIYRVPALGQEAAHGNRDQRLTEQVLAARAAGSPLHRIASELGAPVGIVRGILARNPER